MDEVQGPRGGAAAERAGIYGVALEGLPGATSLLRTVEPHRPVLRVRRAAHGGTDARATGDTGGAEATGDTGGAVGPEKVFGPDRATYRLPAGDGDVVVDRAAMTVTCAMAREHPDGVFVHPFLATAGAVVARWQGHEVLHGGAVVVDGGAWVVLGAREAGKSSLLAQLHLLGVPVLSDDVVVIDDGRVLAGPASIDLRAGAAEHLALGEDLGVVGTRRRWRVELPPVPPAVPLRGFVLPEWADDVAVTPMPLVGRLPVLGHNGALPGPATDPLAFFGLGALPLLRFRRPRSFAQLRPTAQALVEALAAR